VGGLISFYKTVDDKIVEIDDCEDGAWINVTSPSDEDIEKLMSVTKIIPEFLKASLDDEETSHIEAEDDQTLIIIDIPLAEKDGENIVFSTIPLCIIVTQTNLITICLKETSVIKEFSTGQVKGVYTNLKTRFIFQIFYKVAARFLQYLRQIDKISKFVEKQLHQSMKNKELLQLYDLEKSLVYFSTSLKANEVTLEKIYRGRVIKLYEEDQDLLEDVLIEIRQAIEMSQIYSTILSRTMDAFSSIISNNLNFVMKYLSSIAIVISVPNLIAGIYGMNVDIPFQHGQYSFIIPIVISLILAIITAVSLYKHKLF